MELHNSQEKNNYKTNSYRRIVFDEICANFLTLSENRQRIKRGKDKKKFNGDYSKKF